MADRVYTATLNATLAQSFDAFEITADVSKFVDVLEISLSQLGRVGNEQEESLLVLVKTGQAVSGSGGASASVVPRALGTPAFTGTIEAGNTTKASGGAPVTHFAEAWNIRTQLPIRFEGGITLRPGERLTVEIATAPSVPIAFLGNVVVRERGAAIAVGSSLPVHTPSLRAQSFLDRHAINVQIDRTDRSYSTPTNPGPLDNQCIAHLAELNIKTVRLIWKGGAGAASRSRDVGYDYWAQRGVKFCFHTGAHGWYTGFPGLTDCVDQIAAFETSFPGAVVSIEGPNELNWTYQFRRKIGDQYAYTDRFGVTYTGYDEMVKRQEDLLFRVRNTPILATKPVTLYENAPNITAPNGCGYWNKHLYPNQTNPQTATWLWVDPVTHVNSIPSYYPNFTSPFPTRLREMYTTERAWWPSSKPLQMTEFGWHGIGMNFNYEHIALNTIFTWLMLALTYDRLTFFELLEGASPNTITEDGFGLWSGASTHVKRASAQYIINFRAALVDAGGTSFTLTDGHYNLTGLPALGRTLLLQKQNGELLLLIWREDAYFSGGGTGGQPIAVTPTTLALEVDPGKAVQWISPMDSPTATVAPALGKHPLLARIF